MPDPAPTPDPTPAPRTDPAPDPAPPTDPPADDGKGGKDAILADLAKERDARQALQKQVADMQAAQQAQMDAFATALGVKKEDAPPAPEELAAQIESEKANARTANLKLAVFEAAPRHEANASRLLDSASFLASIKDVDPSDAEAIGKAITSAIEADAIFKATAPSAPAAPPPFPGGPRPTPPVRAGSLGEAIANRIASQTPR